MNYPLLASLLLSATPALAFELEVAPLVIGDSTQLLVRDGLPGQTVWLVRSAVAPVPNATCPPALGGACLDLVDPALLARFQLDAQGADRLVAPIPERLAPRDIWLQAIDPVTGEKSPVVRQRLLQRCDGDYDVASAAQVAALTNCGELRGDLTLRGVQGAVPTLPWLQVVLGKVTVSPGAGISEINVLPRLQHASSLVIQDAPDLTSLGGLQSLRSVGSIVLDGLPAVSPVDLLDNPTTPFHLHLLDMPWLTSLGALGTLPPLASLTLQHVNLADLTGLDTAPTVRFDLQITDAPQLTALDGLPSQINELGVELTQVPSLTDLSALANAARISDLWMVDCPQVSNLSAVSGVASVETLYLERMPSVASLAPLASALGAHTDAVYLAGLPSLGSLSGLEGLVHLSALHLVDLPAIADLSALTNLSTVQHMSVGELGSLVSVDGLDSLTSVGLLSFEHNSALADVSALSSVSTAGLVQAYDNPLLCEAALRAALRNSKVDAYSLHDNGACP